ncbi:hypothetical protein M0358_003839 [Vibrio fluvialis]|uniref:50S ribosomal protein L33 n=1 Tax=Vibrio fluvialis TaxID=676 RepID=A0AAX2LRM1_VIBFL|nr:MULTISPECIES: hypothetical protein [Vibrio]TNF11806.1 MAG: hypothetical protein EP325_14720 [Vibrionaceae bacterium]AMF95599.1 hypothetical protein AL536_19735 [Vibrio fluvialis]EKO3369834.1 hypothetical protein [Vibrio fluvialis]EKO3382072.1 hypothetical protein [Vibrio fluvialis]EKO3435232.1 hypothetical protein [Vibrio fluvialis]
MRVAPHRRRRWNNILILAVIVFIGVLNLPAFIKSYLIEPEVSSYPTLLNPHAKLQAMHFARLSLELNQGRWRATPPTEVAPEELVKRWQELVGTEVNDETYLSLQPNLRSPQTIEVWYSDQEEPQRITYYRTPQFWLFKNWQDKWIAISVDNGYLLPSS